MSGNSEKVYHDLSASAQAELASQRLSAQNTPDAEGAPNDTDPEARSDREELPGKFITYDHEGIVEDDKPQDKTPEKTEGGETEEDPKGAEKTPGEEEEPGEDEGAKPRKPKRNVQERINELTRDRRAAERARDQERAAREALEQRLSRLEKAAGVESSANTDEKTLTDKKQSDTVQSEDRPKPEDFKYGEIDPEYVEALADWKVDQKLKARDEKEQQTAEERRAAQQREVLVEKWETHAKKGMERYQDFEEVVIQGAQDGNYQLSNELGTMIIESENGADIAYHLASHPDEAESVYNMTPLEQARWFGATEARFTSEQDAPQSAPVSKAPAPVRQPRGSSGKFETPADTEDFAAFERRARKELNNV